GDPGEGSGEHVKSSDQTGHGGGADSKSTGQEPITPSGSSKEEHQWDPLVNNPENSEMERMRDEGVPNIMNPCSQ
ncbi:hypothetical protein HAX54_043269, partial [Datura stramonium]|nr:hypothetical protein [Datura stramonium]